VAAGVASGPDAVSLDASPRARFAVGAVNGAFGDAIARRRNGLAISMSVRVDGHAVTLERTSVAGAFPAATPRLVVFLHVHSETEDLWGDGLYGARLCGELGYTPVFVRFNSGLPIASNGDLLAELLSELERVWPVPVTEIALIGHSMGGLVAQSACAAGAPKVRHVVSLGAPYTGSWLERAAHRAQRQLARLPETRGLADALGTRSEGIRDMRGTFANHFVDTAEHYFVAATLTRDPNSRVATTIGDLLVSRPSAWAEHPEEGLAFDSDNYRCLGPATHFALPNNPVIADAIVEWLSDRSGRGPAPAGPAARSAAAARGLPARIRSRPRSL
jgi:pimeloyl-ACP methyl ester carboxylesterase